MQMENVMWLLLLYALPVKQTSARVNLWRRLKKFGAVQLKPSAYLLPDNPTQYERFQWLATEIRGAGGEATLIRVAEIDGMSSEEVVEMFNGARAADYRQLAGACRETLARRKQGRDGELAPELERHQRRFRGIRETDYFNSPGVHNAQVVLERVEKLLAPPRGTAAAARLEAGKFVGRTWLTRPRPGIDRAGSAWLIRRFIDPKARFVFGMQPSKHPGALPFDVAGVEFSHHADDCTFETLVKRFGITEKAVLRMAEMVHDADLEDEKFRRCECIGLNAVLTGWARTSMGDGELLAKGIECFEGLYRAVRK